MQMQLPASRVSKNFHHSYKVLSTEQLKYPFYGVRELASLFS